MLPRANQLFYVSLAVASLALVEGFVIFGGRIAAEALEVRRHTHETLLAIAEINKCIANSSSLTREYLLTGTETIATRALARLA